MRARLMLAWGAERRSEVLSVSSMPCSGGRRLDGGWNILRPLVMANTRHDQNSNNDVYSKQVMG